MKALTRKAEWKKFIKHGLALVLATLALPVMAQVEDLSDSEKHGAASHGLNAAARHARTTRAKALAAPLVQNGMDAVSAFEFAWAALAAEAEGKGRAEDILDDLQQRTPEAVAEAMSADEFVALLAALEEAQPEASKSHGAGLHALMYRLGKMLQNDRENHGVGYVSGSSGTVNPRWVRLAQQQEWREGAILPSVWALTNQFGTLLQNEPWHTAFVPPFRSAGDDHSTIIDEEEVEVERKRKVVEEEETQTLTLSLDTPTDTQPAARSLGGSLMSSFGGGGGGGLGSAAPRRMMMMMAPPAPLADMGSDAPGGDVVWAGNTSILKDGVSATFDKTSKALDIKLPSEWRPYEVVVDDTDVTMTKRGEANGSIGYAFDGAGSISDYEGHKTTLTKKGDGILVMANAGNSYSGGTVVEGGTLYVADQGALGTGAVTMHDGTAMWVNYTWNLDYTSSFRNPVVSNAINLESEASATTSATISYGDFVYRLVLGNNANTSSRVWRNLYLTGGISGDAKSSLYLQGYTSRYGNSNFSVARKHISGNANLRGQLWYSGYILNRSTEAEGEDRFYGTLTLGNRTNSSTAETDNLKNRETGAVKLVLSDDVLEHATLDATREFVWVTDSSVADVAKQNELMLAGTIGGTAVKDYTVTASDAVKNAYTAAKGSYKTLGLHQTNANVILISNNTKVGELKADFLGVTQDSYLDAVDWSEALEAKQVRVVTLENSTTLTLGKDGGKTDSWFSGTVGFANQLCDANGDGQDTLTKTDYEKAADTTGSTVAGISMVKVGDNAQYIHSAKLHNLVVDGGTLGFNNVDLAGNLQLRSGTKLRLGVQDDRWTNTPDTSLDIGVWGGNNNHRLTILTNDAESMTSPITGEIKPVPTAARIEGQLMLHAGTELEFMVENLGQDTGDRKVIIPVSIDGKTVLSAASEEGIKGINYLKEHSLLQVTGPAGIEDPEKKDGVLTLSQDVAVSLTGVNFLRENYSGRTYFLAAADKIIVDGESVAEGHASDFASRIVTLGYGFYGIVSTIDGHGYYNDGAYQTYTGDSYLGQDFLTLKVAADPTRSWTGSTVARGVQGWVGKEGNAIAPWLDNANTWQALPGIADYTEYFASAYAELNDAQWKENQVYTDGVSAKFGNLYMPEAWAEFLKSNTNATFEDFKSRLNSEKVTKVDDSKQIFSPNGHGNGIAMRDETGRVLYGVDGSAYFNEDGTKFVTPDGLSAHYEEVRIKGTVRPGYVTVNSDYTLETKTADGKTVYETMTDDTNYVFTSATYTDADGNVIKGCIADATAADMEGIYSGLLLGADLDAGVRNDLANWHTGLAKGGTGTLVMDTENTYSGGSLLRGGLTVMRNRWSLGMEDPKNKTFDDADAKGGRIEMAYGAGLMVDYIYSAFDTKNTIAQGQLTNDLVITHMADFDNTKATGDAQLMNRYDVALVVDTLTSYDDAILTLRGASLAENSFIKKDSKGEEHAFYSYADYVITNPVNAYGTIRMAGYLQGGAGRVLTDDGSAYKYGGGNVQLTISGHDATEVNPKVLWDNTTIDLSLNGGNKNVLAIETRFLHNANGTVTENDGTHDIKLTLGTLKDDGKSGYNACVINDASSERIGKGNKESYLAILTLDPAADATFSGNVGFGIGQNAEGADMPSRGYISLIKTGAATQTIGNARLLDLTVRDSGLMHFNKALSAASISTTDVGAQHIHVGAVEDAAMSHTLTVGRGGVLSFDTTLNADPLANIKGTEDDSKYGKELSYVLLKDGATVTGSGNWYTNKGIAVMGGAEITFNTHDYSMDHTVTSNMAIYGDSAQALKDAFDDSHIFWMKQALAGDKVTLNLVNEQMSVGATEKERGKATSNGYFLTRDLNAYKASSYDVWYGLQGGSTVNIGTKTILQSYETATVNSGITYNVTGTDAALQFLDAKSTKLDASKGYQSYVDKATLSKGGRIILGGAAAATTSTNQNTDGVKTNITADADVVITNKAGQTASVQNMKVDTVNANGYETTLSATDGKRATVKNAEMTVKKESSANNTLVQKTDIDDTMVHIEETCSVTMEDVLVTVGSKVEGEGPASGTTGAAAITAGATAAPTSVTLTNEATRINTTLTTVQNVVMKDVLIRVTKADQLSRTDVGGTGLTLGLTQETLEKATAAGVRYLAIQVSGSGQFTYEKQAVLDSVKLTDHNGATYVNPAYDYKVVSSADVADFLGVDQSEISDTLLYIEVSETPEPTTAALSLLALAGLMARRKRK